MEQKLVKVPFDIEMAKKITEKQVEGRVVDNYNKTYRIVCFDLLDNKGSIIGLRKDDDYRETSLLFNNEGICVQNLTQKLMLEVPEYVTFKDGDVLICRCGGYDYIFIYKKDKHKTSHYVSVDVEDKELYFDNHVTVDERIYELRYATEEERQCLIDVLKSSENERAKEYLKRFFNIEVKSKCDFKVGQPVIGIDSRGEWRYDLFSHYKPEYRNGNYVCSARSYSTCLPYNDQTAHLLGTTENWEE